MRGVWSALAQSPLVWNVRSRGRGWKQRQNEKKKGGWEGKKNSIFVKREIRPRGEFLLGILELEKKKTQKKTKKNILAGHVYQLGQGQGAGLRS